ncbi:hypothetical protein CRG98_007754 [Punica granatum]|uniref:Uncharacterized protein n=1 Tax=Punica granatum TaxID=22663 RepID=A0A2I0KTU2_PUNGR|nr:hypothetical protein CRG98_007754 [Punica granatum]
MQFRPPRMSLAPHLHYRLNGQLFTLLDNLCQNDQREMQIQDMLLEAVNFALVISCSRVTIHVLRRTFRRANPRSGARPRARAPPLARQRTRPRVPASLTLQRARQHARPCTAASQCLHARAPASRMPMPVHPSTGQHVQPSHPTL